MRLIPASRSPPWWRQRPQVSIASPPPVPRVTLGRVLTVSGNVTDANDDVAKLEALREWPEGGRRQQRPPGN